MIVVDDGSTDGSWEGLLALHAKDKRWKAVRFARNFGHQVALTAGLHYAAGDAVIILDADLQDPPEELARFTAPAVSKGLTGCWPTATGASRPAVPAGEAGAAGGVSCNSLTPL